ncbi:hypothetical protein K466DRAFT_586195 [Polyporus arcularius HHB13444]|uniref:Uncharacterized protein n=1 Tax=Polyporus arcularius HHB13444 TaxID=1314778 RepID=A0A5C3PEH2_9APHY|nr:hypothetical protein K466DRAFT_586195 [Polyporus arcularius HHB13444]
MLKYRVPLGASDIVARLRRRPQRATGTSPSPSSRPVQASRVHQTVQLHLTHPRSAMPIPLARTGCFRRTYASSAQTASTGDSLRTKAAIEGLFQALGGDLAGHRMDGSDRPVSPIIRTLHPPSLTPADHLRLDSTDGALHEHGLERGSADRNHDKDTTACRI